MEHKTVKTQYLHQKTFLVCGKEHLGRDYYYMCKDNIICGLGPLREDIFTLF